MHRIAAELGYDPFRINTGRWGFPPNFDELMKNRGIEPILPGRTEDEGLQSGASETASTLPPAAEKHGVIIALENRGPRPHRRQPAARG